MGTKKQMITREKEKEFLDKLGEKLFKLIQEIWKLIKKALAWVVERAP